MRGMRSEITINVIGYADIDDTHTSFDETISKLSENIKLLIIAIGTNEKSVKEMMEAVGLKNRPNFLEYPLAPAVTEGLVKMKYPNSPRHPRQRYLQTTKGLAVYNTLNINDNIDNGRQ